MADSQKVGHLILTAHDLDYFFGPEGVKPQHETISYDKETNDLVIILEDETGGFHKYNTTGALREYINDLKNSGVFTSAAAFVNNRKIYRFYYDQNNGVVRLDPELNFDPLYRYYAIRESALGPSGEYVYITGVQELGELTSPSSHLVDLNIQTNDNGEPVSVPQVGGIIREIIDGNTYVVEFFDNARTLVNVLSFQARAVRVADLDLSPDTAVVDMYIMTNRAVEDDPQSCFLYRGETANKLEIRVYLKYADGRTRDVTYENVINGRLVIQGLNELSTDAISSEGDEPQKFTVVYSLIRNNAMMPSNPIETPEGATLNPQSLTISKEMNVYVFEDIFSNLEKVYCAAYIEPGSGSFDGSTVGDKIRAKFFGLYENGVIYDITNICTYTNPLGLQENEFGTTQHIMIRVPYGNTGQFKTFSFDIYCALGSRQVQVNGEAPRILEANRQSIAGFSGSFTKIGTAGGDGINEVALSALLAEPTLEFHGIVPDHIRVRDILDSSYNYTELANSFGSNGIGYTTTSKHELANNKAVLVEFLKVNLGEGGVVTDVFKTGAFIHFIKLTDGI
jgi:hypothetical protein